MHIGILGPLIVAEDGRTVEIGGGRLRALLVWLALDVGRPVRVDTLADALWGDDLPHDHANAIQSLVSRLRRVLPRPDVLRSEHGGYRLDIDRNAVDAVQFEDLARRGREALRASDIGTAATTLARAQALWRGAALADVLDSQAAAAPAARLEELRLTVTEDRLEAELTRGRYGETIGELEAVVADHPYRERFRGQLMTAMYATGRRTEALRSYESFRDQIADELGADPSTELQAIHLGILRSDLPLAERSATTWRTNLPAARSSFIGRDEDVTQLHQLVADHRLVTLVGVGGAGKTRLATTAAQALLSQYSDGVWMVELASATDPAVVPQAVLGALGIREAAVVDAGQARMSAHDATDRLLEALATANALIVLDNCEHVIQAAATLADQLLRGCPSLRLIATSRESLGIDGEALYQVPPLPVPPPDSPADHVEKYAAAALLIERGNAVRPSFTVTDDNRQAIVDICRRLDGIPLALELAAARLRALSAAQIAARLDDRFRLLTGGSRAALPRHQTLRAVVAWSWDLLTDEERELADRLAVFPGGMTPDSVAEVCGVAADQALDLLSTLVDKSLLYVADITEPRYRMLETIREFGRDRLVEHGDLATARHAHAKYFLGLAERAEPQLRGAGQLTWMRVLDAEHDNILSALRYLVDASDGASAARLGAALAQYWTIKGYHSEASEWLGAVLDVSQQVPIQLRATVLEFFIINSAAGGDLPAIVRFKDELAYLAANVDITQGHPILAVLRPGVAAFADQDERAVDEIEQALDHPDPWARAMLHMMRAAFKENLGDIDGIQDDLESATAGFRAVGDRWGLAMSLNQLGEFQERTGHRSAARDSYREGLTLMRELGAETDVGELRMRLALLNDDQDATRQELEAILEAASERGRSVHIATMCRVHLGNLARWNGDLETATKWYREAIDGKAGIMGAPQQEAISHLGMGLAGLERHAVSEALPHLKKALDAALSSNDMPVLAQVAVSVAALAEHEGRTERAAQLLGVGEALRGAPDVAAPDAVRLVARLRDTLGHQEFTAARASGASLNRSAAIRTLRDQTGELVAIATTPPV